MHSRKRFKRAHWPTKENRHFFANFWIFPAHAKNTWNGRKWGREVLLPTDPDLADILGRTDFDFKNFMFGICLDPKFLGVQVPDFKFPEIWPGPALGRAWAGPGLGLGPGAAAPTGPIGTM